MQSTVQNLTKIRQSMHDLCALYGRDPDDVQLLAVSKKKSAEMIGQVYHAGQRCFGESYVQEALQKMQQLQHLDGLQWHFIGPIQSNKTRDISTCFDWVHSVDRIKIAQRLSDQRPEGRPPLNIFLQVNIDEEASKSGFHASEVVAAVERIQEMKMLNIKGLMAIPKPSSSLVEQRMAFQRVRQLLNRIERITPDIKALSMGMSGDMEAAIAEGSTWVRIGTALFGARE